jgi:hypothetical protein
MRFSRDITATRTKRCHENLFMCKTMRMVMPSNERSHIVTWKKFMGKMRAGGKKIRAFERISAVKFVS